MQQQIRAAAEEDAESIAQLLPHLGYQVSAEQVRSRLAGLLGSWQCAVFLCEVSGQVVGLCLVSSVKHLATTGYAEVLELVVHAQYQRRGIGRSLLARAQAWAASQGHTRVRLRSGVHREDAHRFYEGLGYSRSRASYAFELGLEPVASNPSIERTVSGKPETAAHVERWTSHSVGLLQMIALFSLRLFAIGGLLLVQLMAHAQSPAIAERTRENFMVVVRESIGANRAEDAFKPMGKAKVRLPDGQEVEVQMASWEFIGDTHIRFVFDGPQVMVNATPQDFERLGLKDVEAALTLALENLKRTYGEPKALPWEGGLMTVEGRSPDLNSSYFLDRAYWQELLKKHPEGIVVCVAKRGGVLYTPLSNTKAVETLKRGVAYLYTSSGRLRVSSALYLFKDGKWSVFQAPIKQ